MSHAIWCPPQSHATTTSPGLCARLCSSASSGSSGPQSLSSGKYKSLIFDQALMSRLMSVTIASAASISVLPTVLPFATAFSKVFLNSLMSFCRLSSLFFHVAFTSLSKAFATDPKQSPSLPRSLLMPCSQQAARALKSDSSFRAFSAFFASRAFFFLFLLPRLRGRVLA